jgi:hypothetical protein
MVAHAVSFDYQAIPRSVKRALSRFSTRLHVALRRNPDQAEMLADYWSKE